MIEEEKEEVKAIEEPKLKLLDMRDEKSEDSRNDVEDKGVEKISYSIMDKQRVLSMIYKYKNDNICPSVKQLIDHTGLTKEKIHDIKKEFEETGILKSEARRTLLLCDYEDALQKIS